MNPFQIFLLILAGLVLLLLFLLFLPVRLYLCYNGKLTVKLKILCFSFSLYPKKKKWKMKDHLPEYQRKKKSKKKATQSHVKKEKQEDSRPFMEKISDLLEYVTRLLDRVILPLLGRLKQHLTVRISRFEIVIGSEDAAKSALLYASAVNAGYALLAFLDEHAKLKKGKHARIAVSCPFTEYKSTALCELELGIHLVGALFTLLPALYTYLTEFSENDTPSHKV